MISSTYLYTSLVLCSGTDRLHTTNARKLFQTERWIEEVDSDSRILALTI